MSHLRYSQVKRCTTGKECFSWCGKQLSMSHLRYSQVRRRTTGKECFCWCGYSMSHLRYSQVKRCTTGKECSVGVGTAQYVSPEVLTSKKGVLQVKSVLLVWEQRSMSHLWYSQVKKVYYR